MRLLELVKIIDTPEQVEQGRIILIGIDGQGVPVSLRLHLVWKGWQSDARNNQVTSVANFVPSQFWTITFRGYSLLSADEIAAWLLVPVGTYFWTDRKATQSRRFAAVRHTYRVLDRTSLLEIESVYRRRNPRSLTAFKILSSEAISLNLLNNRVAHGGYLLRSEPSVDSSGTERQDSGDCCDPLPSYCKFPIMFLGLVMLVVGAASVYHVDAGEAFWRWLILGAGLIWCGLFPVWSVTLGF